MEIESEMALRDLRKISIYMSFSVCDFFFMGKLRYFENDKYVDFVIVELSSAILKCLNKRDEARIRGAMDRANEFRVDAITNEYLRLLFPDEKMQ